MRRGKRRQHQQQTEQNGSQSLHLSFSLLEIPVHGNSLLNRSLDFLYVSGWLRVLRLTEILYLRLNLCPGRMGKVIIISGPVGAGKSAVARELVSLWPGPLACIEGDTFWSFIAKPGQTERRENFHVIMRSMTAACIPFTRSGYVKESISGYSSTLPG